MWALSPVEAVQGEAALLVVNVSAVDPAIHGQHLDVLGCHPLTGPRLGAGLLGGLGAQLEGRQPQHRLIGHLVRLLCKQDTMLAVNPMNFSAADGVRYVSRATMCLVCDACLHLLTCAC